MKDEASDGPRMLSRSPSLTNEADRIDIHSLLIRETRTVPRFDPRRNISESVIIVDRARVIPRNAAPTTREISTPLN